MSDKTPQITLTDSLVKRLRALQAAQGRAGLMLRVAVLGGGCSGFQYQFSLIDVVEDDDRVFDKDGVKVAVDNVSMEYLQGSTIDFTEELIGASFQIRNPNATSSCGCGTSFSV